MMKLKELLILGCLILGIAVIHSCKKDVSLPVLTTSNYSNLTTTSVTSGGTITSSGGADVTARGVCYSTSPNPKTSGDKVLSGKGSGTFVSEITGLTPNTKYYVAAYATNSAGTAYGDDISFTTVALTVPALTTVAVSDIGLNTAVSGGTITTDGGAPVTAKGVCWSTSENPTTDDDITTNGDGSASFTSNLTGLTPGTTYYVRAYATNSVGTGYGVQVHFTTTALSVPTVTTTAVTNIQLTTASSGGEVTSNGGADVSVRGVCWSTELDPIATDAHTTDASGIGSFTSSIINLEPGVTYHVRAYATNSVGTGYGLDVEFETLPVGLATLTTKAVNPISYTTATSGGDITDAGGGTITARGVCYGTANLPDITGPHTPSGSGTGSFTTNITGLTQNTTYYIRAYATNSAGTAYGDELTFKTTAVTLAIVTTTDVSLITTTTARSGGSISSAGGGNISEKGVCWSETVNPTTDDAKLPGGTGTTTFVSNITSLNDGTDYHVRAYAINEAGTAYGDDIAFTTIAIVPPTVTTAAISAITATTASSGGDVTDEGNGTVSAKGVCWSTGHDPIATGSHTTNGTGSGAFTSSITGLSPNTIYYVRAYATNSAGTSYGDELTLTTYAATDIDGNNYHSILIGTQTWLRENLKTTRYNNGDLIGTTTLDLTGDTAAKYQWYVDNNSNNTAEYGLIYTWGTAHDSRHICPTGWHVPTDPEWEALKTALGGQDAAGGELKETGLTHWTSPNTGATNGSGFTALGSGYRNYNGSFASFKLTASFWSSTENPINKSWGWGQGLRWDDSKLVRYGFDKPDGCAVRCIKNP